MSNNNNNGAEKNRFSNAPAPQRSKAGFVWLLIMLILGTMILFNSCSPEQKHDLNQSIFEQRLKDKAIESIVLIPEGENVYNVEGKLKEKTSDERGNQYISRIILSDELEKVCGSQAQKSLWKTTIPFSGTLFLPVFCPFC